MNNVITVILFYCRFIVLLREIRKSMFSKDWNEFDFLEIWLNCLSFWTFFYISILILELPVETTRMVKIITLQIYDKIHFWWFDFRNLIDKDCPLMKLCGIWRRFTCNNVSNFKINNQINYKLWNEFQTIESIANNFQKQRITENAKICSWCTSFRKIYSFM